MTSTQLICITRKVPRVVTSNIDGKMYQILSFLLLAGLKIILNLWLTARELFFGTGKVPNLHSKYVLITGCDSGFGRETAVRLDRMGIHVLATCLTEEGANGVKLETSERLKTFVMNVTDARQIQEVFGQVKQLLPSGNGRSEIMHYYTIRFL